MIKHLINASGMRMQLDKTEIAALYQALEPYVVGIALGVNDSNLAAFGTKFAEKKKNLPHRKSFEPVDTTNTEKNCTDNVVSLTFNKGVET